MKRGRTAAIVVGIFTIVVVIILISSFALSAMLPQTPRATATVTSEPTMTSTPDPCSEANMSQTVDKFDALSREFNDAFILAQNTPAVQLSPVITDMQRIRREAQDYAAPICLATLKQNQLGFMNAAVDSSLALFSNANLLNAVSACVGKSNCITKDQLTQAQQVVGAVNQGLNDARQYSSQYTIEMARLLGITLTPSPTSLPIGTPGTPSAEATATP